MIINVIVKWIETSNLYEVRRFVQQRPNYYAEKDLESYSKNGQLCISDIPEHITQITLNAFVETVKDISHRVKEQSLRYFVALSPADYLIDIIFVMFKVNVQDREIFEDLVQSGRLLIIRNIDMKLSNEKVEFRYSCDFVKELIESTSDDPIYLKIRNDINLRLLASKGIMNSPPFKLEDSPFTKVIRYPVKVEYDLTSGIYKFRSNSYHKSISSN